MKKKLGRLTLHRDTLRHLDGSNLREVVGQSASCAITQCGVGCTATVGCTVCLQHCSVGC